MKPASFNIYRRIFFVSALICLFLASFPANATIFIEDGSELDESGLLTLMEDPAPVYDEPIVLFFYDPECSACVPTHEFLDLYLSDHPDTVFESVNLEDGQEAWDTFEEFKTNFSREKVFIPVIYIGPVALEGKTDIMDHFEEVYSWYIIEDSEE